MGADSVSKKELYFVNTRAIHVGHLNNLFRASNLVGIEESEGSGGEELAAAAVVDADAGIPVSESPAISCQAVVGGFSVVWFQW